jgi:hypothetical protein
MDNLNVQQILNTLTPEQLHKLVQNAEVPSTDSGKPPVFDGPDSGVWSGSNVASNTTDAQNGQQALDWMNAYFGGAAPTSAAPLIASSGTTADKTSQNDIKTLLELLKMQKEPEGVKTAEYKQQHPDVSTDEKLAGNEMKNLQDFLSSVYELIQKNPNPQGGMYTFTSDQMKSFPEKIQELKDRLTDVTGTLSGLSNTDPAKGDSPKDKEMDNYYNSLLVEKNVLNSLTNMLSKVNAKNPAISANSLHGALDQIAAYNQQLPEGTKNQYGMGSDALTKAILAKMGTNISPTMKSMSDWQAYTSYIDKFMEPFLKGNPSEMRGEDANDVLQRASFEEQDTAGHPERKTDSGQYELKLKKQMEENAGKGLATFVNLTNTMDPNFKKQLQTMLPIWTASKGLNWKNVQKAGQLYAPKLLAGAAAGSTAGVSSASAPSKKKGKAPKKTAASTPPDDNTNPSMAEDIINKVKGVGKTIGSGLEDFGQQLVAPEEGVINKIFTRYPKGQTPPSFLDAIAEEEPQSAFTPNPHTPGLQIGEKVGPPAPGLFDPNTLRNESDQGSYPSSNFWVQGQ